MTEEEMNTSTFVIFGLKLAVIEVTIISPEAEEIDINLGKNSLHSRR